MNQKFNIFNTSFITNIPIEISVYINMRPIDCPPHKYISDIYRVNSLQNFTFNSCTFLKRYIYFTWLFYYKGHKHFCIVNWTLQNVYLFQEKNEITKQLQSNFKFVRHEFNCIKPVVNIPRAILPNQTSITLYNLYTQL